MRGVSFAEMKSFYSGTVSSVGKGQEMSGGESFLQIFDKTQGYTNSPQHNNSDVKGKDGEEIQERSKISKKPFFESVRDNKKEINSEALEETAQQMKEKIAEVLDVSVEEVENVLEALGISMMDLLSPEVLTQVVLALNPQADVLQIMTDENLYADLKALTDYAKTLNLQICEQFGITEAELKELTEEMKADLQLISEDNSGSLSDTMPETAEEAVEENVLLKDSETENKNAANLESRVAAEKNETVKTGSGEEVPVQTVNVKQENSNHAETGNESGQEMFKNFFQQLSQAVDNVETTNGSYTTNGQEIIRQITEHIRIQVGQETTEMELQLHPASLGSVKVQIASTGGVLTAVFTTENETVKAALETQLIQLKESFEQQGLKVESVEVNVSAQAFERSLDQQEREQNSFAEEKDKKRNRRIRLSGSGDLEDGSLEELAEEDKVVADMMIRNGNSVDYMV